jgi:sensitive to high expression protein 9
MDNMQSRALAASATLNSLTGYSAIEAIKAHNTVLEQEHGAAQTRLRAARGEYKAVTAQRASTQREVSMMLARKDSWTPTDLERFTTLYRTDHSLEGRVAAVADDLAEAEAAEAAVSAALNAGILRRYHEEQIWSDHIRRASTWGTWGLMAVNVLLFLGFQFVAEPWRRRRLINAIADGEQSVLAEVRKDIDELRAEMASKSAPVLESKPEMDSPVLVNEALESWGTIMIDPRRWLPAVADLNSERRIDLRMRDATAIAVEGAIMGAAVTAAAAFFLIRNA